MKLVHILVWKRRASHVNNPLGIFIALANTVLLGCKMRRSSTPPPDACFLYSWAIHALALYTMALPNGWAIVTVYI